MKTASKKSVFIAFAIAVIAALTAIAAAFAFLPHAAPAHADDQNTMDNYEIFPTPHDVTYSGGTMTVTGGISLDIGDGIDGATRDHALSALSRLDVLAGADDANATSVLIGVHGSGDAADAFVSALGVTASHFDKIDAYVLYIGQNTIAVVGKDTDSAFYGLTTLDIILEQAAGRELKELTVLDYSDCKYRGFIEGYYGTPWTTDERISLMEYGSRVKSNIYIYAPKNDSYHSNNWRGLYSGADLSALKRQVEAGVRTKTQFAWSIHPFLYRKFTRENYDADLADLLAKFEQLYSVGVRRFVVSADDVAVDTDESGNPIPTAVSGELHRDMLNDVVDWLEDKGDCYDLIFVPSAYCYGSDSKLRVELEYYYQTLMPGLDPSVEIMWTGEGVTSTVSDGRFAEFGELTGGRKAFMWMNWPVTDMLIGTYDENLAGLGSPDYMLLGRGEVFDIAYDGGEPEFSGIVVNPMQYAEPSKLSVFSACDYCWNIDGFDIDKSYIKSFELLDADASEELFELAENVVNYPGGYGVDRTVFRESEIIAPYVDAFTAAMASGQNAADAAAELKTQFDRLIAAADGYVQKAANIEMLNAFMPWVDGIKAFSVAAEEYIDVWLKAYTDDTDGLEALYKKAQDDYAKVAECKAPFYNYVTYAPDPRKVGFSPSVLEPFMDTLRANADEQVAIALGVDTGVTSRGFTVYEGKLENIVDGTKDTYVWFDGFPDDGSYVRVDLGRVTSASLIRLLTGKPDGGDIFRGYMEYSEDGRTYTRLGDLVFGDTVFELDEPISVRYIKIVARDNDKWVAIRELYINSVGDSGPLVRLDGVELEPSVATSASLMTDDNLSTYAWFAVGAPDGATITLDFTEVVEVSNVQLLMAKSDSMNDVFRAGAIEYSTDGRVYEYIDVFDNSMGVHRTMLFTLDTPVKARFVRLRTIGETSTGVVVRDFSINRRYGVSYGSGYSLYDDGVRPGYQISHVGYATDGDDGTFLDLIRNDDGEHTVLLDLFNVRSVKKITVVSGGFGWGDKITDCKIEYSFGGTIWHDAGGELHDESGTFVIEFPERVGIRYVRLTVISDGWITIREFGVE